MKKNKQIYTCIDVKGKAKFNQKLILFYVIHAITIQL